MGCRIAFLATIAATAMATSQEHTQSCVTELGVSDPSLWDGTCQSLGEDLKVKGRRRRKTQEEEDDKGTDVRIASELLRIAVEPASSPTEQGVDAEDADPASSTEQAIQQTGIKSISMKSENDMSAKCKFVSSGPKGTLDCILATKGLNGPNNLAFTPDACPDGNIASAGFYVSYSDEKSPLNRTAWCAQWQYQPAVHGNLHCETLSDASFICSQQKVGHVHRTGASVGYFSGKRIKCTGDKCAVYKTGLCIDVKEDVYAESKKTKKQNRKGSGCDAISTSHKFGYQTKNRQPIGNQDIGCRHQKDAAFALKAQTILENNNDVLPETNICSEDDRRAVDKALLMS